MSLDAFMSPNFVRPLGWTLLHSCWQLAALALMYQVAASGPLRSAQARHRFATVALWSAPTVALATFFWALPNAVETSAVATLASAGQSADLSAAMPGHLHGSMSAGAQNALHLRGFAEISEGLIVTLENWAPILVLGWFLGVLLGSRSLLKALEHCQHLRDQSKSPASPGLESRLKETAKRLGLERSVALRTIEGQGGPVLVGWLQPVILVPRRMCSAPIETLEPVLCHELAHVKRHDYATNLVSAFVASLFFYHPAIFWLRRQSQVAREQCCDDVAVAHCQGGVLAYLRSLAELEALRLQGPGLALRSTDGDLLRRVRRLAATERPRPSLRTTILAMCALSVLLVTGAWSLPRSLSTTTVLGGLDPVYLVEGRNQTGKPTLSVGRNGYRYLFADTSSRDRFLAQPERYSVTNLHACPITQRKVRPDAWAVVDDQIVLFCCHTAPDMIRNESAKRGSGRHIESLRKRLAKQTRLDRSATEAGI